VLVVTGLLLLLGAGALNRRSSCASRSIG
jgi:hypothetical protein